MNLDPFWQGFDAMMRRIELERPATFDALAAILAGMAERSSGEAFCLEGGSLMCALEAAGWDVYGIEGDYLWEARTPGGDWIHYVEGDLYRGRR